MNGHALILAALLLFSAVSRSFAVEVIPGEVRAPKPGITALHLAALHSERGERYVNGVRQAGNPEIHITQYQVRLARSFEIASKPAACYVQVPAGQVNAGGSLTGLPADSGIGDTTMAVAIWPYANRGTETYFGIAGYLQLPTGSYEPSRSLNVGDNSYKTALLLGFQRPLADKLQLMATYDGQWTGVNPDFGVQRVDLEKAVIQTLQATLIYTLSPQFRLAAGYFYIAGGESRVNGVALNDAIRTQRYQLSALSEFSFGGLILQYGGDLEAENGYIEKRRLSLRYIKRF